MKKAAVAKKMLVSQKQAMEIRHKKWLEMQKDMPKHHETPKPKVMTDDERNARARASQPSQEYQRNYQKNIGRAYND